ncbi:MAG: CocE/NonD family hydrolase, partial [Acidobacteriota bacterium]|nr:CocE/NonD family hydrolase [Acidobacteriota bacterium]
DDLKRWKGRNTEDGYDYFKQLGGLKETADSYEKGLGIRIKFWDDMMAHPNYDQFWKDRNILPKLKNITCATMTVGGWYDNEDLYGALKTYEHIEKQNPGIFNVLVVGPWFHGGWARSDGDWLGTAYFGQKTAEYYRTNMELPFFNHFLKDKGDISKIKEVNLFDTGANEWRSFENYEPTGGTDTALYLTENGGLSFELPAAQDGFDEYVSNLSKPVPYTQKITSNYPRDFMTEDQRFAASRPDVLVYQTAPLTEDITVVGDIKPSLTVSSSGTDSDFIVKLIDVFPDEYKFPEGVKPPENSAFSVFEPGGYQMLLRGEPMPARFRNSFEKPEPLKQGEPTKLAFVMPGVAHTFKKGHRIMVQIQSTWFPLVARNPQKFVANYKQATQADFQNAAQRVYFGGKHSSAIVLPIIKR